MKKIGLMTAVPIEVIYASGNIPVDLSNVVAGSSNVDKYIEAAERDGFPKNMCAWIKGIYGLCVTEGVTEVVGVVEGSCSNSASLVEILRLQGINVVEFSYPKSRKLQELKKNVQKFMEHYEVTELEVEWWRLRLNVIREKVKELDELTNEGKVSSFKNHKFHIGTTDFFGNPNKYEAELEKALIEARAQKADKNLLKLAYLGVPPIFNDFYDYLDSKGARVIFNEVQREYAFPRYKKAKNIYEQYLDFTYPYLMDFRFKTLEEELSQRDIKGVIHYTQEYCHKTLDSLILKEKLRYPLLNIESDKNRVLDDKTKVRLNTFIEMLSEEF